MERIVGTAGHIDHGKTALVRALTGIDTDRLQEEKARGISIELGFAHMDIGDGERVAIVDVPGHERFIRNMLAGAAGIDVALLVVAADDAVMPQTREHLAILELLGITEGVIALTKADLADADWLDLVEADVRELVQGTFLANAPIVRTSAPTGAGIEELRSVVRDACDRIAPATLNVPFRLHVDRAFTLQGRGTVVTGSVAAGVVHEGDEVAWLPAGERVKVRGIHRHGESSVEALRGQRAALNLAGVHHTAIERGHVLAAVGSLEASTCLSVRIRVLPDGPWDLRHRERVRLHVGTQEAHAEVRLLEGNTLVRGEWGLAQLRCVEPVVAVARQPFVLRAESPVRTIGGGVVLQPVARPIARRNRTSIERLELLHHADAAIRAEAAIAGRGDGSWTDVQLARDADLTPGEVVDVLARLKDDGKVIELTAGARMQRLHADVLSDLVDRLRTAIGKLHANRPMSMSVPRGQVDDAVEDLGADLTTALLGEMERRGEVVLGDGIVRLTTHEPALTAAQEAACRKIVEAYSTAGYTPPEVEAVGVSAAAWGVTR